MPQATPGPAGSEAPVDMRDPAWRDDPHPLLRELRERSPVARDMLGIWLVGRHADVNAGLRSAQLSRELWRSPAYRQLRPFIADSPMERMVEQWMLFNEPPKHTRLRRLARPGTDGARAPARQIAGRASCFAPLQRVPEGRARACHSCKCLLACGISWASRSA